MKKVGETARISGKLPEMCQIGNGVIIKGCVLGEKIIVGDDSILLNCAAEECVEIERRNLIRNASVGRMTYTGADTSIMWAEVGRYCSISRMVDIGGNEHNYHAVTTMPTYQIQSKLAGRPMKHPDETTIVVGNDVWIGQGVSIIRKDGLAIANGAVIGSGAVVTKSVPPYAIVAGVPARVIGYRFAERFIDELQELQWWNWEPEKVVANWQILSSEMNEEVLKKLKEV